VVKGKDTSRAYEKVPRGHYKGGKLLQSFVLRKLNNSVNFLCFVLRKLNNSVNFLCMPGSYFFCKILCLHLFLGLDFGEMSSVLNGWLNSSVLASPCSFWKVEEIQQLQALLYLAR